VPGRGWDISVIDPRPFTVRVEWLRDTEAAVGRYLAAREKVHPVDVIVDIHWFH
jgi:hypothetical protein